MPSTYSEWLRVERPSGIEVGLSAELRDPLGDLVRVPLLLVRVLEELVGHGLGVNARGHEVVALVAQHADDLGRQRLVENAHDRVAVRPIALGDRALLDVPARPRPKLLDIRQEWPVR